MYIKGAGISQSVRQFATGWKVQGSNHGGGDEIFHTCPDRPWGPPSLSYNGYRVFPGVRQFLYSPGEPLSIPGGQSSQILRHSAHEGNKIFSLKRSPPLPPRNIPNTHFMLEVDSTSEPSCGRKDSVNEKLKRNRTHDLPACSAMSQQTASPRALYIYAHVVYCSILRTSKCATNYKTHSVIIKVFLRV